jgi:hypothetical protein
MTFDEALPALIRAAAPALGAERARRVLVIRDLLGQLRLVVDSRRGMRLGSRHWRRPSRRH